MQVSVKRALIAIIRTYKMIISPLKGQTCRFHPNCSQYAIDAIEKHGAAKGLFMALYRIIRCNPLSRGGLDPVK